MLRALVVTNMWPSPARPALGSFVRDHVSALRRLEAAEVEVFAFGSGGSARAYPAAGRALRRRFAPGAFDVVHAHFGLTGWPARAVPAPVHAITLHGTDLAHPRSRAITLAGLPLCDLVAVVSAPLAARVPAWATRGGPPAILPTGVALDRHVPVDRAEARRALGLRPDGRYLLFPADPARAEKRVDRATALAEAVPGAELVTLGAAPPEEVPLWIGAADAVLVTSDRESFGLAALEALAGEVPVLSTPVGVAPEALADLPGVLCAPFDTERWRDAVAELAGRRVAGGRERASRWSTERMAQRTLAAWTAALARS